jgi:hypothetical protein
VSLPPRRSAEAGRTCFRSSRPACTLFHINPVIDQKDKQMSDKPTNSLGMRTPNFNKPNVENVAGYGKDAPAAATYNRGAKSVAEIAEAAEARRQHGRDLLNRPTGPRPTANRDAK